MSAVIERGSNSYRENVQIRANEPITVAGLLDPHVLEQLERCSALTREKLLAIAAYDDQREGKDRELLGTFDQEALFTQMVERELLKVMVVISGQGPEAFGMPEMFTPVRHINASRALHRIVSLISDGRYSGTTWGAAIGHVTPEAPNGGWIGLLDTGDLSRRPTAWSTLPMPARASSPTSSPSRPSSHTGAKVKSLRLAEASRTD